MLGAGGPADGLVGQRITAGPDNITVLIIAAPDANIQEITSRAETVADHLNRLKAADPVMVLDQPGFPRTFIPPDYQLGVVQAVTDLMGGGLSTIRKGTAPLGTKASSTVGYVSHLSTPSENSPQRNKINFSPFWALNGQIAQIAENVFRTFLVP